MELPSRVVDRWQLALRPKDLFIVSRQRQPPKVKIDVNYQNHFLLSVVPAVSSTVVKRVVSGMVSANKAKSY